MTNPKHEAKQKLNGAVKRFRKAVENHKNEDRIRKAVGGAIALGANGVQAFEAGIAMTKSGSGKLLLDAVDSDSKLTFEWNEEGMPL
jgi:hypothetical protein